MTVRVPYTGGLKPPQLTVIVQFEPGASVPVQVLVCVKLVPVMVTETVVDVVKGFVTVTIPVPASYKINSVGATVTSAPFPLKMTGCTDAPESLKVSEPLRTPPAAGVKITDAEQEEPPASVAGQLLL